MVHRHEPPETSRRTTWKGQCKYGLIIQENDTFSVLSCNISYMSECSGGPQIAPVMLYHFQYFTFTLVVYSLVT